MRSATMLANVRCLLIAVTFVAACAAQADSHTEARAAPVSAAAAKSVSTTPTPEQRARGLLNKQIKALPSDDATFVSTFAPNAVVTMPYGFVKIDTPDLEVGANIADLHPHAELKSATIDKLVVGGSASMVWLAADIGLKVLSSEPEETPSLNTSTVRVLELLDAASDWKVVAASFTKIRPIERRRESRGPMPLPTAPDSLVKLLTSPGGLVGALASDPVVVFGTEAAERAVGQSAAKVLLNKWRKLPLEIEEANKVREVHTTAWGYAMAAVNISKPGGPPYRMSGFVIAEPSANGAWSVVAASYGAL